MDNAWQKYYRIQRIAFMRHERNSTWNGYFIVTFSIFLNRIQIPRPFSLVSGCRMQLDH